MNSKLLSILTMGIVLAMTTSGCEYGNLFTVDPKPMRVELGVIQINLEKLINEIRSQSNEDIIKNYDGKKINIVGRIVRKWTLQDGRMCLCIGLQDNPAPKEKYYAIRIMLNRKQMNLAVEYKVGEFVSARGIAKIYEPENGKGKSLFFDIYDVRID